MQKVLAQAGVASRRQVERLIAEGRVTVNGEKVSVMGTKVSSGDAICVDGALIERSDKLYYYLLNKPVGVVTTARDPQGRSTVVEIMQGVPARVYPVGRLDFDTAGLLVMTNDGELAHRLMHPSYGVEKTYRVWVHGPVGINALEQLRQGVNLSDGKTAPAKVVRRSGLQQRRTVAVDQKSDSFEVLEVTIHEGKNRQVRRMLGAVGYPVVKLERIAFGPLNQERQLLPGNYRSLTKEEVQKLRALVGLT
ncbi:pseudouridine synthase [Desulfosporosinus sp. PR]|nr:pseudouridine synthase [Desulfosporosinus sp. PR]MDQ7096791.1 pseudouridine synthase [Desulfosporosinus sp. PR]